jgi:hypothetical protein
MSSIVYPLYVGESNLWHHHFRASCTRIARVLAKILMPLATRDVSGGPVGGTVGMTPISFAGKIIYAHSTTNVDPHVMCQGLLSGEVSGSNSSVKSLRHAAWTPGLE